MTQQFPIENISLQHEESGTLHRQLYFQLRGLIERRILPSGSALPSTRQLAKDLVLGRNTVIAAYDQLALEGFITVARGRKPVVIGLPLPHSEKKVRRLAETQLLSQRGRDMSKLPFHHGRPGMLAFHPGMPDAQNFPFNTWSKLLTRRAKQSRHDLFGTYHITGHPPLREALARYLQASRGVDCEPEQIIITNGAQSAFDLLARLLLDPGDCVWMEEPGYYGASAAFTAAGAKLAPLRVNGSGWELNPPERRPRMIFVTPSCQHPLGITMNMEQRLNLLHLADAWGSWIIEDDYDSEYRFQGQPIPALQGAAASERVVFVGTFAKILFPAMRLGYMVVPRVLQDAATAALSATGQFAPLMTQAALADFINEGHLTRHLRQMRRLYAARRLHFIDEFNTHLSRWMELNRTETGIQLAGFFRRPTSDRRIAGAARKAGINVSPLSMQYRSKPARQGLLFGFAATDQPMTNAAMQKLGEVIAWHAGPNEPHVRKT